MKNLLIFIFSIFSLAACAQNPIIAPGNAGMNPLGTRVMTDPVTGNPTTQAELLHQPVKYATLVPLPANTYSSGVITASNNADTLKVDGYVPALNDRLLVKNEAVAANNGIYTVTQLATSSQPFKLTRGGYSNVVANLTAGSRVSVQFGEINAGSEFIQATQGAITIGTTPLIYIPVRNYMDKGYSLTAGFNVVGTSIEAGLCNGCPGSIQKGWLDYLAASLNITSFNNYALSSTSVRYACYILGKNIFGSQSTALISGSNFNMTRNGFNFDTVHTYAMTRAANHRIAAMQFTNTVQFYRQGNSSGINANITTSGSAPSALIIDTLKDFSSAAVYYVLNDPNNSTMNVWFKSSVTANETITITNVPGQVLGVGVMGDSTGGSRIQYAVDGVTIGTYNPNGICDFTNWEAGWTFHRQGIMPDEIIISGLRDTLHTVVLTFLDGGTMGYFDHIASLKTAPASVNIPYYIIDNLYMNSTGYALTGGNKISSDSASNSVFRDIIQTFPSYPIFRFNANYPTGLYNVATAGMVQSDGVHPTTLGAWYISQAALNAINLKNAAFGTAPGSNGDIIINSSGTYSANNNFIFDRTIPTGAGGQLRIGNGNAYPFTSGAIIVTSTNSASAINLLTGNGGALTYYKDSSQGANVKIWEEGQFGGNFYINRLNDANTARTYRLAILSNGNAGINSGASSFTPGKTWDVVGSMGYTTFLDNPNYYTSGFGFRQGDLIIQSNDAANNIVADNAQIVSGTYKYIKTAPAAKIQFLSSGGIYYNVAASGTAGTTITFVQSMYEDNDGRVSFGPGAGSIHPNSWADFSPSTTAHAALEIFSGPAPTSPIDGDMWNNSSTHHLYNYLNGTTYQIDQQVAAAMTSGQTTLVSGTKAISISGVTTSSKAIVTVVTPSGTSLTTMYQAVCTSGTVTIQANIAAGTINTSDGSTVNYIVIY